MKISGWPRVSVPEWTRRARSTEGAIVYTASLVIAEFQKTLFQKRLFGPLLLVVKLKNSCNFVSFAPIELRLRLRKVDFFHLGTFFHRQFIFKSRLGPRSLWLGPDPCPEVAWPRSLVQRRAWQILDKIGQILVQTKGDCPGDQSVLETLDV